MNTRVRITPWSLANVKHPQLLSQICYVDIAEASQSIMRGNCLSLQGLFLPNASQSKFLFFPLRQRIRQHCVTRPLSTHSLPPRPRRHHRAVAPPLWCCWACCRCAPVARPLVAAPSPCLLLSHHCVCRGDQTWFLLC